MATGTKSLREIKEILTAWGIETDKQTVQSMFRNKFYMGILSSPKYPEEIRGQHIPMVTQEQFYRIQAILDGRDTNKLIMPRKSRDNEDFPLRRIIRCGKCGTPFTGAWTKGRHGKYGYYFCRMRCVTTSIKVNDLDDELKKRLDRVKPTEEGLKFYCTYLRKTFNQKLARLQKTRSKVDEEIKKLYALRQTLVEKNLAGIFSDEIFKEQNVIIEEKIIAAHAAKNDELINKYDINTIIKFIETKIKHLPKTYEKSTLSQIRCLLGSIFMTELSWQYPGCSKGQISPIYQPICSDRPEVVNIGSPTRIRTSNLEVNSFLLYR